MLAKQFYSKLGQGSRSNIENRVNPNFGLKYVMFGIKIQDFHYLLHIKGFQMHLKYKLREKHRKESFVNKKFENKLWLEEKKY